MFNNWYVPQADDSASKADGADGGGASPSAKSAESSPPTVQLSSDASAPQCGIDGGNDSGAQGGSRLQSMTQDSLLKVPAIENGSGNGGNNSGDDTGKLSSQTSGPSRQELDNNLRQGGARQRGEEEPGQSGGQRSTLKPEAGFAAEVKVTVYSLPLVCDAQEEQADFVKPRNRSPCNTYILVLFVNI